MIALNWCCNYNIIQTRAYMSFRSQQVAAAFQLSCVRMKLGLNFLRNTSNRKVTHDLMWVGWVAELNCVQINTRRKKELPKKSSVSCLNMKLLTVYSNHILLYVLIQGEISKTLKIKVQQKSRFKTNIYKQDAKVFHFVRNF